MADHSKPTMTSYYATFVDELDARFDDLAVWMDPALVTSSNMPVGSVRWASSVKKWQKWSGTGWIDLSSGYNIPLASTYASTITVNSASAALTVTQNGAGLAINAIGDVDVSGDISAANISSGSWTPEITAVTNVATTTVQACQFLSIGGVVTFSGTLSISPVAAGAASIGISLPVAANLTSGYQAAGVAIDTTHTIMGVLLSDAANDRMTLATTFAATGGKVFRFSGTYRTI